MFMHFQGRDLWATRYYDWQVGQIHHGSNRTGARFSHCAFISLFVISLHRAENCHTPIEISMTREEKGLTDTRMYKCFTYNKYRKMLYTLVTDKVKYRVKVSQRCKAFTRSVMRPPYVIYARVSEKQNE